jgi:hypothetical protein
MRLATILQRFEGLFFNHNQSLLFPKTGQVSPSNVQSYGSVAFLFVFNVEVAFYLNPALSLWQKRYFID